jgi:hypothetical protein
MTSIDFTPDAPDLTRFADKQPELGWTAFMVGTLLLLYELREKARAMCSSATPSEGEGPEQAAAALLDALRKMADQAAFEPGLAEVTIDGVQMALYWNITAPARWGSWAAVQAAMREAADEIAVTVSAIADEFEEILADLEALRNPDDAERTSRPAIRNVIAMMRVLVEQVRYAGAPAQG